MEASEPHPPFAEHIGQRLASLGHGQPRRRYEHEDETHFGNAVAIFHLDGLVLRFLRDRGPETIEIDLLIGPGEHEAVPLESIAAAEEWIRFDDLLSHYGLDQPVEQARVDHEAPPVGPFLSIDNAFGLFEKCWDGLRRAAGSQHAISRAQKVEQAIQQKTAALLVDADSAYTGETV